MWLKMLHSRIDQLIFLINKMRRKREWRTEKNCRNDCCSSNFSLLLLLMFVNFHRKRCEWRCSILFAPVDQDVSIKIASIVNFSLIVKLLFSKIIKYFFGQPIFCVWILNRIYSVAIPWNSIKKRKLKSSIVVIYARNIHTNELHEHIENNSHHHIHMYCVGWCTRSGSIEHSQHVASAAQI